MNKILIKPTVLKNETNASKAPNKRNKYYNNRVEKQYNQISETSVITNYIL